MRNIGTAQPDAGRPAAAEPLSGVDEALDWLAERRKAIRCECGILPLEELDQWRTAPGTGDLEHDSGRFFRIEGLQVSTNQGPVGEWRQPIINQPEVGVLGLLVRRVAGDCYGLVQAKMEPGNIDTVQFAPTVQATRSNYTRAHRGAATRYLEQFEGAEPGRVRVDVLQSEQGARFRGKRNRNMVVEVFEDVPVSDGYRWIRLDILRQLHLQDNVVNMCLRSVLSCLAPADSPSERYLHTDAEVLSWIVRAKIRHELSTRGVPLAETTGWHRARGAIAHESGKYFSVIGISATAAEREVHQWSQPMIAPRHEGIAALLTKRVAGVDHVLIQAKTEAGYRDNAELAPTVQCITENYRSLPAEQQPKYLAQATDIGPGRCRYRGYQSEEGGRFYRQQNRYFITEVEPDFPDEPDGDHLWVSLPQLQHLVLHSNYLNIEARSLLSCLYAVPESTW